MKKIFYIFILLFLIIIILFSKNDNNHNYIMSINDYKLESKVIKLDRLIKKETIDKDVLSILFKYPSLNKFIKYANIKVPNVFGFIPQGIEVINKYIFITGYFDNQDNSICYILDETGNIVNKVILDTNSHVGSISYDKLNNLIFIPGEEDSVYVYNLNDFFTKENVYRVYQLNNLASDFIDFKDKSKLHIAFLRVDEKFLYIGSFNLNEPCLVKKYIIEKNNNKLKVKYINSFKVNKKIQSITFINKNNNKYMILSSSYGRKYTSNMYVYLYNDKTTDYEIPEKTYTFPPMMEQISIYENTLYMLFESNAYKYSDALDKMSYIIELDVNKMFL